MVVLFPFFPKSCLLTITCRADGIEQEGLLVSLSLRMRRKNDFRMIFGPSDPSGQITVNSNEIESEVESAYTLFPMDYGDISEFKGEVVLAVLDCPQLESAIRAFDLFHKVSSYPPDFRDKLVAAWKKLFHLRPKRLEIEAIMQPPSAVIHIQTTSVIPGLPGQHP